jgi:hypothetical protein
MAEPIRLDILGLDHPHWIVDNREAPCDRCGAPAPWTAADRAAMRDGVASKPRSLPVAIVHRLPERAPTYSTPQHIATRRPPIVESPSTEPECDACGGPNCTCEEP